MAKKKINAKDRRAAQAEMHRMRGRAVNEEQEKKRLEEEAARKKREREALCAAVRKQNPALSDKAKSLAKAAGRKSTFYIGPNRVLITSFGNGSDAVREKMLTRDGGGQTSVESIHTPQALEVTPQEQERILIRGRSIELIDDDPFKTGPKEDLIHVKGKLEERYFGRAFEDNIHVQLAHCIQDVNKILATHVNDIVFTLNNLLRTEGADYNDLMGYMSLDRSFDNFSAPSNPTQEEVWELFRKLAWSPQRGYLGEILRPDTDRGPDEEKNRGHLEYCYHILAFLGSIRQAAAHGDGRNLGSLYQADSPETRQRGDWKNALELVDRLYRDRIREVNDNFTATSDKDLKILRQILEIDPGDDSRLRELARNCYRFVVLKEQKYLGFSIRKLRETIAAVVQEASWITDDAFASVRQRLYRLVDFLIWRYYEAHPEEAGELVNRLRASLSEVAKEVIYREEAVRLWGAIAPTVGQIRPKMDGTYIKSLDRATPVIAPERMPAAVGDVMISAEGASFFSKIIYLMTRFMDGKEINDLITQLINKFDNIASFLDVMRAEEIPAEFRAPYELFADSRAVALELRSILSFARMSEPTPKARFMMMKEAAEILGYDDEDLDDYIREMMDPKGGKMRNGRKDNGFRNFIMNNVIESGRFKYLVRYGNPKKIRNLATNRTVIGFVLEKIPDTQIRRYYDSCMGVKDAYREGMREELTDLVTGLSFRDFENVHQNDREAGTTAEQRIDKERKKSLVNLYLTVLYHLLKNLVYVNARYFLAFYCLERDHYLADPETFQEEAAAGGRRDWARFAADFLAEHPQPKARVRRYLQQNFENADRWAMRTFRNQTDHMNVLRNADRYIGDVRTIDSYFWLFHYLTQRTIMDQFAFDRSAGRVTDEELNAKTREYFDLVERHKTYCKDMVKALNVPFAYNLPRYKNLSINELFDRNDYRPNDAKGAF